MRPSHTLWLAALASILLCSCPHAKPLPAEGGDAVRADRAYTRQQASEAISHLPAVPPPSGAVAITIPTADLYSVAGWYFAPEGKEKAPAVILLHQRGRDKSNWGDLPEKLVHQGFAVISIDLRGHGETKGPGGSNLPLESLKDSDYKAMLNDVAAAHQYLLKQKGVDGDRVGIIGASIGANLGIMYCAGDRRVRTVVALSPGLDYKGLKPLDYMQAVDKRPLYLIAAEDDSVSVEAAEQLCQAGTVDGPKSVRLFDGKDHGSDILRANPGLDMTIVTGWLLNYLPPVRHSSSSE
jgi:dienelactone hydrolase